MIYDIKIRKLQTELASVAIALACNENPISK